MSKKPSFRDLTKLSAYLDGELNASAQQRMKNRLARLHPERSDGRDPELASALDDLRLSRTVLRRTPKRRAPRSFSLSPQMVAKRPPMPRLVPALNYASVMAMLLFLFSFLGPVGFGGNVASEVQDAAPMLMEAPAAEAPMEEPAMEMAAEPAADSAMEEEAPAAAMPAAEEPAEETGENFASAPPPASTAEGVQAEKTFAATEIAVPTMTPLPMRVAPEPQTEPASLLTPYQRALVILLGLFAILSWVVRRATIAKWQKAAK